MVTPDARRASIWSAMLCCDSYAREYRIPPVESAPTSSNTERSKENGAWSSHTSP